MCWCFAASFPIRQKVVARANSMVHSHTANTRNIPAAMVANAFRLIDEFGLLSFTEPKCMSRALIAKSCIATNPIKPNPITPSSYAIAIAAQLAAGSPLKHAATTIPQVAAMPTQTRSTNNVHAVYCVDV